MGITYLISLYFSDATSLNGHVYSMSRLLTNHLPTAAVAAVPAVALSLICVLLLAAFLRRNGSSRGGSQGNDGNKKQANVLVNPMLGHTTATASASPYATSYVTPMISAKSSASSSSSSSNNNTANWLPANGGSGVPQHAPSPSPAFIRGRQWRPLLNKTDGEDSNCYMEVTPQQNQELLPDLKKDKDDEDWVEVTNKGNQTPSHWVYSDMISNGGSEMIYANVDLDNDDDDDQVSNKFGTAQTYLLTDSAVHSASNSPALAHRNNLSRQQQSIGNSSFMSPQLQRHSQQQLHRQSRQQQQQSGRISASVQQLYQHSRLQQQSNNIVLSSATVPRSA